MAQESGKHIQARKGTAGGVRGAWRPVGQAAVGLASLLGGGALAQQAPVTPEAPPAAEAAAEVEKEKAPAPAPEAPSEPYVLPTVQVQGETESYRAPESALTRLPVALIDTPQTVAVVPQEVMEEQNASTVRDALRNVSGITITAGEGGRQGDTFILRGFSAQTDVYRDGVRDLGWYTRDTFNLGSVETFFGPSSVLFGRGSTGGAINLVSKKPGRRAFQEVRLVGGTAPSGRAELDVNQPVNEKVQLRVSAAGQLAEVAGRDEATQNRLGVAPSVRVTLGEATSLEVDYLFQRESSVPDYGHPYLNSFPVSTSAGVPRDTFYGVQGSDLEQVSAHIGTARLLHTFAGNVLLANTLRFGQVARLARTTSPRGLTPASAPTAIGRQRFEVDTDNTYLTNQTDLRVSFLTASLEHTANAGFEVSRETRDQYRDDFLLPNGGNPLADLYLPDPRPDLSAVNRVFRLSNQSDQTSLGVYLADQVKVTSWLQLMASLRFDHLSTEYVSKTSTVPLSRLPSVDRLFNWRVGAVYQPLPQFNVYGMAGTSSNPSAEAGVLASGQETLAAERNQVFELGAKADVLGELLGVTAALFRIDKTDGRVANPDPAGPPVVLTGQQRSEGLNVGLAGRFLERWSVFASYTFLNAYIASNPNPYLVGQPLPTAAPHSGSLWTTFAVTPLLTLGGGAVYQGLTPVNNPVDAATPFNYVPAYWRFDAFASYAIGLADVQLNLNNLTDKLYYQQFYSGHAVPAEARTVMLGLKVRL